MVLHKDLELVCGLFLLDLIFQEQMQIPEEVGRIVLKCLKFGWAGADQFDDAELIGAYSTSNLMVSSMVELSKRCLRC